jgi:drug/metabolite transporter (DMT)-like permease
MSDSREATCRGAGPSIARRRPLLVGAAFALGSALTFGLSTPIVARFGRGLGPFATAALLYAGACGSALLLSLRGRRSGSSPWSSFGRLALVALFGAGIAPTLLAWGLQRVGGSAGSLLLNLEVVFTILLARLFYRESLGGRVVLAMLFMALGGVALAAHGSAPTATQLGVAAIAAATLAWAIDNTLTRRLSEHDPLLLVAGKGALGASLTATMALVLDEPMPRVGAALALLACGASGYGLSLRLYLLAQRRIGAARTASLFAVAPFIGAFVGWAMGEGAVDRWTALSGGLLAAGVLLHLGERHAHAHAHPAEAHEHLHRHDEGHHTHLHDPPFVGEHSHTHTHEALTHEHEHLPDPHHTHEH